MVSGAEDRAEGWGDAHERRVWPPNSVVTVGGDVWVRVLFRVDGTRVGRRSADTGTGPPRAGERPCWVETECVSNERFAAFVGSTGHVTDAERAGYSFVVVGHLTNELRPGRAAVGTEWWREVPGADWRHPTGPGSTVIDRLGDPVVHVSLREARAFCAWSGLRLPTGEEWVRNAGGAPGGGAAASFFHGYWLGAGVTDRPGAGRWEWVCGDRPGAAAERTTGWGLRGGSCGCDTPGRCPYRLSARMTIPPESTSSTISFRCVR